MIDIIKRIIDSNPEVTGYEIVEKLVKSKELFLVKDKADMDRAKNVHHYKIIIYKDIEEDGTLYKGVATTSIHPTMSEAEIKEEINEALFAAQFAKNEYYPLVKNGQEYSQIAKSTFANENLSYWVNEIARATYENDIYVNGGINSCEIFLDKIYTRVINSDGIDVNFENYAAMVEFIPTWKGENEEIELYSCLKFSDFNEDDIADQVRTMINISKDRAVAIPTPKIINTPILLTRDAVSEFISYYYFKSSASAVYNRQSNFKIGDSIQGSNIQGDLITFKLDPHMNNSTYSAPFSNDGLPLREVRIIENGILKNYIANNKFAHYLNVAPTGDTLNIVVQGGSKSLDELKYGPYIEIAAFSDFTMDVVTGNFGGEIRLGWYNDGSKVVPVTGGSISANINDTQESMYLSRELQHDNNFVGPKAIKLSNVTIAGE